jgi:hypothetical protein
LSRGAVITGEDIILTVIRVAVEMVSLFETVEEVVQDENEKDRCACQGSFHSQPLITSASETITSKMQQEDDAGASCEGELENKLLGQRNASGAPRSGLC